MRILAIDGGGVRGMIPAMLLEELERRTGQATSDLFDYIVGTSTGGIIALGLACPAPGGGPAFSATRIVSFLQENAPLIFPREHFATARQIIEERYPSLGLDQALESAFGETRLSDAVVDVMVTTYDVEQCRPIFLRRSLARAEPGMDLPMRLAARATAAAPTYFSPLAYDDGDHMHVFVDGGIVANNPVLAALAHAREAGDDLADVVAVSLGTGAVIRTVDFEHPHHRGLVQWAGARLFSMMLDGSSAAIDHHAEQLLGKDRYHRLNTQLMEAAVHFDDASLANLEGLAADARTMIAREGSRLDHIAELLTARSEPAPAPG